MSQWALRYRMDKEGTAYVHVGDVVELLEGVFNKEHVNFNTGDQGDIAINFGRSITRKVQERLTKLSSEVSRRHKAGESSTVLTGPGHIHRTTERPGEESTSSEPPRRRLRAAQ